MKSIPFAVFGKDRDAERLIYDLADETEVDLTFSHTGEVYRVLRGIKRGKKGQTLKLWSGDKEITERLASNTQKKIDEILKFTPEFLFSTSVAEQDQINKLSTMTPGDREKVLSEMLSLEMWERKKKKVGDILNDNKNITESIKEYETELAVLTGLLKENKDNSVIEENNLIIPSTEKYLVEKQLQEEENNLQAYEEYNKLLTSKNILETEIKGLQSQLKGIQIDDDVNIKIDKNKRELEENNSTILEIKEGLDQLRKELFLNFEQLNEVDSFLKLEPQTKILENVPCVGMDIHSRCELLSSSSSIKSNIKTYLNKWSRVKASFTNLEEIKNYLELTKDKHQEDIKFLEENESEIGKKLSSLTIEIKTDEAKLKDMENAKLLKDLIHNKTIQLKNLQIQDKPKFDQGAYNLYKAKLLDLNNKIQKGKTQLTILETEKKNINNQIEKLTNKLQTLKETDSKLSNYRTLHGAYNEIPTLLFEQAIPTLEDYTNEILERVSPGKRIQLRSFRETKSNTQQKALDVVSTMSTGVRDFEDLSGSAKFRQSLALRIALARYNRELNNVDINWFMVDEGFGSLDEENVSTMKMMLKEIASHFSLFLMVSHVPELRDAFDTQIIVNNTGKGEKVLCIRK